MGKHLEPLQGIKLLQGHTAMHIAMFIVSFYINSDNVVKLRDNDQHFYKLKLAFTVVTWGHLVSAVFQILSFWLKSKKYYHLSRICQLMLLFTYFLPLIYVQWIAVRYQIDLSQDTEMDMKAKILTWTGIR